MTFDLGPVRGQAGGVWCRELVVSSVAVVALALPATAAAEQADTQQSEGAHQGDGGAERGESAAGIGIAGTLFGATPIGAGLSLGAGVPLGLRLPLQLGRELRLEPSFSYSRQLRQLSASGSAELTAQEPPKESATTSWSASLLAAITRSLASDTLGYAGIGFGTARSTSSQRMEADWRDTDGASAYSWFASVGVEHALSSAFSLGIELGPRYTIDDQPDGATPVPGSAPTRRWTVAGQAVLRGYLARW